MWVMFSGTGLSPLLTNHTVVQLFYLINCQSWPSPSFFPCQLLPLFSRKRRPDGEMGECHQSQYGQALETVAQDAVQSCCRLRLSKDKAVAMDTLLEVARVQGSLPFYGVMK